MSEVEVSAFLLAITKLAAAYYLGMEAYRTRDFDHEIGRAVTPILVSFLCASFLLEGLSSLAFVFHMNDGLIVGIWSRIMVTGGVLWAVKNMQRKFG